IRTISCSLSLTSPGGIALETIFSISKLPADDPGLMPAPDLPPFRIEPIVRRSNPAWGEAPPWQAQHFASRIGAISDGKPGGLSRSAAVPTWSPIDQLMNAATRQILRSSAPAFIA